MNKPCFHCKSVLLVFNVCVGGLDTSSHSQVHNSSVISGLPTRQRNHPKVSLQVGCKNWENSDFLNVTEGRLGKLRQWLRTWGNAPSMSMSAEHDLSSLQATCCGSNTVLYNLSPLSIISICFMVNGSFHGKCHGSTWFLCSPLPTFDGHIALTKHTWVDLFTALGHHGRDSSHVAWSPLSRVWGNWRSRTPSSIMGKQGSQADQERVKFDEIQ